MVTYQSWSVVFGEQPSAAKWNILGSNDSGFNDGTAIASSAIVAGLIANGAVLPNKLIASASTLNTWAWDTYVPTLTSVTTGNGTITGRYIKVGKTVFFYAGILFGTTTAHTGTVSISLPVASINYGTAYGTTLAQGSLLYSGGGANPIFGAWTSTTTLEVDCINAAGTYASGAGMTATAPVALGSGHAGTAWYLVGFYETP